MGAEKVNESEPTDSASKNEDAGQNRAAATRSIDPSAEDGLLDLHPQIAIGANDDAFTAWVHENLPGSSIWDNRLD